jgi:RHS repeat-associated protein
MATPSNLSEQILALPDGAGAAEPAAQTFQVRPYTGTGSYTIPIETRAGHAGLSETMALVYSTHSANGIAGQGWSLDLASVERRIDKGIPSFDNDTDLFTLQGDELLPVGGGAYRMRIEGRFSRIRHVIADGRDFWAVTERDGKRVLYGLEPDHRLHDDAGRIAAWYVSKVQDANGNAVDFTYIREGTSRDSRLTAVEWAGCYRVTFRYEVRPDPTVTFRPGFAHTQQHRLSEIDVEVRRSSDGAFSTYRMYSFSYRTSPLTGRSLLSSVAITGINPDGSSRELPPLTFSYTEPDLSTAQWHTLGGALPGGSLKDRNLTLVRQSGSGLPDLLETTEAGHWLRTNLGDGIFSAPRRVTAPAQVLLEQQGTFISNMSGHGWGDLVVNGGSQVYQAAVGGGWGATYVSPRAPSVDLESADVRLADLNGDGIPDALRSNSSGWLYFENQGGGRWAPAQRVVNPPPVGLDDERVHLADINGDGIPDLVYMERSRIRVWPGVGAGRFGPPFEMQHPPDLGSSFDPKAVRWADMTGSGQSDLLYVRNGTVTICFNYAGSAFSDPVTVARVPQSEQGHVEPVDLLGSGAQGLLFTDEQYRVGAWRYLDLFVEGCPDLLATIDYGFGAVTSIEYATSARDWIADKRSGKPCRTALPSPQVVVSGTTTLDTVTNTRVGVRYRYHHGVYDGAEREFRGYARVEQIDREADAGDAQPLAPVLVKRWYFTGADVDLRDEYTPLPEGAVADDIPRLPWALRSLRGQQRREETFAQDGNPRPYLVAQTGYRVFAIQRTPGTARYSFAPLPFISRQTYLERSDERRTSETTTIYDCDTGTGYGLPVEVREKGYSRVADDAEPAQRIDLERYTRTRYVSLDRPDTAYSDDYSPVYITGKPALTEKYGVTSSGDVLLERTKFFYDGEDYKGLGYPGSGTEAGLTRGRLSSQLVLAFTNELLSTTFAGQPNALSHFTDRGRYLEDADGFYIHAARSRYDARGMTVGIMDPNGNATSFTYDAAYGLFPVLSTDPAGHPSRIVRGEWPFQAATVLDANGNTTSFTYDPTGFLEAKSVQGKFDGSDWTGDPPTFPTESYAYDLDAKPVQVIARRRQIRYGATLDSFRYLDGFGRVVQEVQTAEPDPNSGAARYRVSGWKVFNHKGLAVRIYQPKFSDSEQYVSGATSDASVEIQYDPLGRAIRLNHPDGPYETTTYHPWVKTFADRNDNSGEITAEDPRYGRFLTDLSRHAGTPGRSYMDALGRIVALAEDNGDQVHTSRKEMDLADRVIAFWDARGAADPTWSFTFDFAGRPLSSNHPTATGERFALLDASGNGIWARDGGGTEVTSYFDMLNRRVETRSDDGSGPVLRRKSNYLTYDEHDPNFTANQAQNLFGRTEEERDADGIRVFEYDWRGLNTRTTYRFWPQTWDDAQSPLWTQGSAWDPGIPSGPRDALSWLDLPGLDSFEIATAYDSSARPIEMQYPGGMAVRNTYNAGGLLSAISADRDDGAGFQVIVDSLEYNARGQHVSYRHGNGVMTTREYDPDLERLIRITTQGEGSSPTYFQDLSYSHDPMGNLLEVMDDLTDSTFSHNRIIPNTRRFGYDPRYRLVRAEGKKHRSVRRREDSVLVPSPDPNDYEPYTFRYAYDAVGNFVRNPEYAGGEVQYVADRSDLFNGAGDEAGNFRYDASGNTTHTPRHEELAYTFDGKVRYVDLNGGGIVRYLRHGDERVVRMANKNGARDLSIYAGNFEYHIRKGTRRYAKLVLHVNGHGRHAQMERILSASDPDSLDLFFHHSDYIKSGHVLTTKDGDLLSQEEYFPFGSSSDRRDARNRYRFIGVERDEDTHLCMTGPRTYDPATGRFLQPDPIAENSPNVSPFVYSSASPIVVLDPGGYQSSNGGGRPEVDPDVTTEQMDLDIGDLNAEEFGDTPNTAAQDAMRRWEEMPLQERAILDFKLAPPGLHSNRAVWETTSRASLNYRIREAQASGESAARSYAEAQQMMTLGAERGDMELVTAADEVMRDVERSMEIRSAASATDAAAVVGLRSAADAGLELAARHLAAGIPLVNLLVAAQTLADAKDEYNHGEYLAAGLQVGSLVYEPIAIGIALADARVWAEEKYKQYRAEQTSISIDNEIRRLNAQQSGESQQPAYTGPCDICHYGR